MGQRSSQEITRKGYNLRNYGQMNRVLNTIPEEIYIEILLFLDYRSILNFGKTCSDEYRISSQPYIWRKKLKNQYFNELPDTNIVKNEELKKAFIELSTSIGNELFWDFEKHHRVFSIQEEKNIIENSPISDVYLYVNARTKQYLLPGYVYEWVITWKEGAVGVNNLIGIGVKNFDMEIDGGPQHTVGNTDGGIGVLVGGTFNISFNGKQLLEFRMGTMEAKDNDEFWFRFDSREKSKSKLYFAHNDQEFAKIGPDLDMINSHTRFYPQITIFNQHEMKFVIEKKKKNTKKEKLFEKKK